MAVKVEAHASLEDAIEAFTKECKPVLKEAERHKHFVPDREKHHHRSRGGKSRK